MIIWDFSDYRSFIKCTINAEHAEDTKKSISYFSKKIGKSASYLKLVLSGRRNLMPESALVFSKLFKLSMDETNYLLDLVGRDNTADETLKKFYLRRMLSHRKKAITYSSIEDHRSVFENSLLWEVHSLTAVSNFVWDAHWIASHLTRRKLPISVIQSAMKYLEKGGFVVVSGNSAKAKDIILNHNELLKNAYKVGLERAAESITYESIKESYFDSFCLILNQEEYEKIFGLLSQVKRKIAQVASSKSKKGRIAFFNSNLFWVSR